MNFPLFIQKINLSRVLRLFPFMQPLLARASFNLSHARLYVTGPGYTSRNDI